MMKVPELKADASIVRVPTPVLLSVAIDTCPSICLHSHIGREAVKKVAIKALKRFHPDKVWIKLRMNGRIHSAQHAASGIT